MGRSLLVTLALLLALPATAAAGTFTWAQPSDFSHAGRPANPDHDSYGRTPWSYVEGATCTGALCSVSGHSHDPASFTNLASYDSSRGGWTDPADSAALVGPDAGGLGMTAPADRVVALGWTSPLGHAASVSLSGTVSASGPTSCFAWSLEQGGATLAGQAGAGTGTITATATVSPGEAIYLVIDPTSNPLVYKASCATATVSLTVSDSESAGPTVTLDSPGPKGLITVPRPTFSGTASTGFGAAPGVTVRIYSGNSAGGTPAQTLTTTRKPGGSWSVPAASALPDGTYTAQAEQDDLATPPDAGYSAPVTFTVHTGPPTIHLNPLSTKPLPTATPTISGTAGNAAGDSSAIGIAVYPGPDTSSSPVRLAQTTADADGHFSATITPALPDGQYTVIAGQQSSGGVGFSQPVTFSIKLHPPLLTIAQPAPGASIPGPRPTFSGTAGSVYGDSPTVLVALQAGESDRPVGSVRAPVRSGGWSVRWPKRLAQGLYTLRVSQSDDAGHVTRLRRTFLLVPAPTVVGTAISLSRSGVVQLPISCLASSGVCRGTVLALTTATLRTRSGGPTGHVRVLFAYVAVPAGRTQVVRQTLPGYLTRVLRRAARLNVRIIADLSGTGRTTAVRPLVRR